MEKKFNKKNNPGWFTKSAELLHQNNSENVEHLFKLYAKDKYLSRVVYMNDPRGYENFRLTLFTEENGDFSFVYFRKKFGISITNKIYSSEKRLVTISYKEGKFWLIDNLGRSKSVRPLTMNFLIACFPSYRIGMEESLEVEIILNRLEERFTWIRFIREHKVLGNTAFNTIIKNKLYNLKKALQHQYKVPKPIALIIHESNDYWVKSYFKHSLPYIKNVESLKLNWLTNNSLLNLFRDTLKMAKILDEKVNCSWSDKRLRLEHDSFTKRINDIIFIGSDRQMKINEIYLKFAEHSRFKIISTTKEMAYEGKKQNHCVGTYVNKVDSGLCGIYRVNDYTLELNATYNPICKKQLLYIAQFKGYSNSNPPEEIRDMVSEKVKMYNYQLIGYVPSEHEFDMNFFVSNGCDELPF